MLLTTAWCFQRFLLTNRCDKVLVMQPSIWESYKKNGIDLRTGGDATFINPETFMKMIKFNIQKSMNLGELRDNEK